MRHVEISSLTNERIKRLVRLRERAHRDEEGVFVVEGNRLVNRARDRGLNLLEIYVTPGHQLEDEPISTIVEPGVLDKASYRNQSEGLIAVFEQFPTRLTDIAPESTPLILVAESVEKPGNLGAILRTADAVGATALVTTGSGVDLFNPNVIRSSTGAIFSVPYAHADLSDLTSWLDDNDVELVVAFPDADVVYWDADLAGSIAILVGAEHVGVSEEAAAAAQRTVAIPMSGISDSLNVSVSIAVLAFEARRQQYKLGH